MVSFLSKQREGKMQNWNPVVQQMPDLLRVRVDGLPSPSSMMGGSRDLVNKVMSAISALYGIIYFFLTTLA